MPELTRSVLFVWIGWLLCVGLLVGSIYTHQPYTEDTVTIEGNPVEVENQSAVLTQDEMSAEQYHIANSLLSDTLVVQEYENENWYYKNPEEYSVGGGEYNWSVIEPFYSHSVVQVDGSYYELKHSTETMEKFDYFTIFDMMFLLMCVVTLPMVGSQTSRWWNGD